ncbi:hypothetical protein [Corynebacterium sp. TAE3-ERU16]|uniref:hypothetical protein n=1 Tax=Corynebacterium sp. TAE3-ERU16 TaxID=2849493 RepID=UPI001C47B3CC|nr:hypothetical protein [Corynebacterium sp. TAE3-ERU16]MBV7292337.1 hypothetical protein [Corynebacterium sp. TAE3-ERU16]
MFTTGLCEQHHTEIMSMLRVDPGPTINRIRRMHDLGICYDEIADSAHLTTPFVEHFGEVRPRARIAWAVAAAIEQVRLVEPWPAVRRVRALLAAGHPLDDLATEIDVETERVLILAENGRPAITEDLDQRIRGVYRAREADPVSPPEPWIEARRWPVPFMWDNIDDQAEHPMASAYAVPCTPVFRVIVAAVLDSYSSREAAGRELRIKPYTLQTITAGTRRQLATGSASRLLRWWWVRNHSLPRVEGPAMVGASPLAKEGDQ